MGTGDEDGEGEENEEKFDAVSSQVLCKYLLVRMDMFDVTPLVNVIHLLSLHLSRPILNELIN